MVRSPHQQESLLLVFWATTGSERAKGGCPLLGGSSVALGS